jgi:hypothetical protein
MASFVFQKIFILAIQNCCGILLSKRKIRMNLLLLHHNILPSRQGFSQEGRRKGRSGRNQGEQTKELHDE